MFLKRGCWHPLPGRLGLPFGGRTGKNQGSAGGRSPTGSLCLTDPHLPTAQPGLSNDPPGIWGKWLESSEQQTIVGVQANTTPSLYR